MSTERLNKVSDLVTYTNSFFDSIRRVSHRSIVLLIELGLITAIIALATAHNTVATGIMVIAGVGVAMNLFTIDSYNRDYAEFQRLCESFADQYRGNYTEAEMTSNIDTIRQAAESYANKYKMVSVINAITLAVVAISVCMIVMAII